MPRWVVAWAWGSRSMTPTRRPHSARAAARLTAVVVLPTPPFWLMMAIRRMEKLLFREGRGKRSADYKGLGKPGKPQAALPDRLGRLQDVELPTRPAHAER